MSSLVGIFSAILLTVFLFSLGETNGNVCIITSRYEKSTSPGDLTRLKQRVVKDVMTSSLIPINSRRNGSGSLTSEVIANIDNASKQLTDDLYRYTLWALPYIAAPESEPGFCYVAEMVNATVEDSKVKIHQALNHISTNLDQSCNKLRDMASVRAECKPSSTIPKYLDSKCWNGGHVYMIEELFRIYGKGLPESIKRAAINSYHSNRIGDNVLAAGLAISITPSAIALVDVDSDDYVENANLMVSEVLHEGTTKCGCKQHRNLLKQMCTVMSTIIEEKILGMQQSL